MSSPNNNDHNKQQLVLMGSTTTSDYSSQEEEQQQDKKLKKTSNSFSNNDTSTTATTNTQLQPTKANIQQVTDNNKRLLWPSSQLTRRGRLKQILILALFFIGLIVCVTSIACILLLPAFVSNQIARKLVLKNNSLLLERWSKPNVPMFFKVWIFDIKNAHQIAQDKTIKPQLEEIGPFVFNLRRQKDVVSFAGDNLYYTERKIYHFNRELSCCAINTTVTIPNIPLVAVVDRALSYNLPLVGRFIPRLINRAIQSLREQLFVRKQVGEILFDGYEVDLLKMVSRIGSLVGLPQQSQRFALLKGRNDTWRPEQDGVWAINTGARDRQRFGKVSSWNSYKQLPFWPEKQCNVINGSDGTLFPPPIRKTEPLYIFNPELCRTVNLVYQGPSDVRSIQAYRFALNPMNFAHTMSGTKPSSSTGSAVANHLTTATSTTTMAGPSPRHEMSGPPSRFGSALPLPISSSSSSSPSSASPQRRPSALQTGRRELRPSPSERLNQQVSPPASGSSEPSAGLNSGDNSPRTVSQQAGLVQAAQLRHERPTNQLQRNPNTCFCDRKATQLNGVNVCEFDGLIELSRCTKQAQVIFGSMPHFHNGDSRLASQVDGLQANASKHTTYLDIEPNTGLVLGGKRRVQLNLLIKNNKEVDGFENINDMLIPLVWFEESAQIPEESARKFKSLYTDRIKLVNLILLSLLVASVALLAIDLRLLLATNYWKSFKLTLVSSVASPQQVGSPGKPPANKKMKKKKVDISAAALNNKFKYSIGETNGTTTKATISGGESRDSHLSSDREVSSTRRSDSPLLINELANSRSSETSPDSSPELPKWSPRLIQHRQTKVSGANASPNFHNNNNHLDYYNSPATATTTVVLGGSGGGGGGGQKTISISREYARETNSVGNQKQKSTIVNLNGAATTTANTDK